MVQELDLSLKKKKKKISRQEGERSSVSATNLEMHKNSIPEFVE